MSNGSEAERIDGDGSNGEGSFQQQMNFQLHSGVILKEGKSCAEEKRVNSVVGPAGLEPATDGL